MSNYPPSVEAQLDALTFEQQIGHLLCPLLSGDDLDQFKRWQERDHYGSVFFNTRTFQQWREATGALQSVAASPVVVAADLESGAKSISDKSTRFPWMMAAAACDDEEIMYQMGRATGVEGRHAGIHWTFAPVVDISYNYRSGVTNIRGLGDDPDRVLRMARAHMRGVQENNRIAAAAKHFPGDGLDERDQHLLTSINNLTVEAWMATFGRIWRELITDGLQTIMSGHISFPAWQGHHDNPTDALPATLCPKLQIELLRKELGFEGVLVSDAAPMVGLTSRATEDEAIIRFIEAGGDVYLFARPERDFDNVLKAVHSDRLSEERVRESARRVLRLKQWLGLHEDVNGPEPSPEDTATFANASQAMAEGSITLQKDNGLVGQAPPKDAKILVVTISYEGHKFLPHSLDAFNEALQAEGYSFEHLSNPGNGPLIKRAHEFDTVFLNFYILPHMETGHTRLYGARAMHFWRAFYVDHPDVRCTSFGTPYILHDQPHLPNMLLAYCGTESSQRAALDVWLGKLKPTGICPVRQPRVTILDQPPAATTN